MASRTRVDSSTVLKYRRRGLIRGKKVLQDGRLRYLFLEGQAAKLRRILK